MHSRLSHLLKLCLLWICFQSFLSNAEGFPLRLTGGSSPNTGRLEVQIEGQWGIMSIRDGGENIAQVACRVLGYRGYSAVSYPEGRVHRSWTPELLRNVMCTGNEPSLRNCSYSVPSYRSFRNPGIGILCLNKTNDQVPLQMNKGSSDNSGRVQVNLNGVWQSVCNENFNLNATKVVCRNLGFSGVSRMLMPERATYGASGTEQCILFTSVKCQGTEPYILDCIGSGFRTDSYRKTLLHIVCTDQPIETFPLRLVDGAISNRGIVEAQIDGIWARICSGSFGFNDANVACRTMGYRGFAAKVLITEAAHVNGIFWLDGFSCSGNESHLLACSDNNIRVSFNGCGVFPAAIACTNHTSDDFAARLTDRITADSGRLEVEMGGVWGTVCHRGFNIKAAHVACRHLGYSGADGPKGVVQEQRRLGPLPIWISNLHCTGTESSLSKCSYDRPGLHTCNHNSDVSVRCRHETESNSTLRLMDGTSGNNGRLEIQVDGVYGTVCKDQFGEKEGNVACRDMGYWRLHEIIKQNETVAPPSVPVWLDNVQCEGSEMRLIECSHNGLGIHNCSHDNDTAIRCLDHNAVRVRLAHGVAPNMGRLEIMIDGIWGTVCNDKFDYKDATVACRMLGFKAAYAMMDQQDNVRADSVLSIWLDNVNCTGRESHLLDCAHKGIGTHDCSHKQDVGLKCLTHLDQVSARLKDGLTPNSGRFELQIDGVWGSVCRRGFGRSDATVACRMLGVDGTGIALVTTPRPRGMRSPFWMYDVNCKGDESSLLDCPREIKHPSTRSVDHCSLADDVSLMCLSTQAQYTVSVRLVNGTAPDNGILEIRLDGMWGSVLSNSFDKNDARVACRMLGYNNRGDVISDDVVHMRPGNSAVWLDELDCKGDETSLLDCDYTLSRHYWQDRIDVSIKCE